MRLASDAIEPGAGMPPRYTADGENVSPPVHWEDVPDATGSYVLLLEERRADGGLVTHWLVYDVPFELKGLQQGRCGLLKTGRNDFDSIGYSGPCPRAGDPAREYCFQLFALDVESLHLPAGAARDEVVQAMAGHVLARAELDCRYARPHPDHNDGGARSGGAGHARPAA